MTIRNALFAGMVLFIAPWSPAAITIGLLDDFEDGSLGGWDPAVNHNTTNVAGGPAGSTRYLEIAPASRLAAYDAGPDITGAIDPAVDAITVDMFRDVGLADVEIRLVLFGPTTADRWTSTVAQTLSGDGLWNSYTFSVRESDLTQVLGAASYSQLTANLDRIMVRHDSGTPNSTGTPVAGTIGSFGIDNVAAIPEPTGLWLFAGALAAFTFGSRRRAA